MEHPPMRVNNLLDGPLARRVIFQGVFIAALALVAFVIGPERGSYELGCTMAFGVLGSPRCCAPEPALRHRPALGPRRAPATTAGARCGTASRHAGHAAGAALHRSVRRHDDGPRSVGARGGLRPAVRRADRIAKAIGRWRAPLSAQSPEKGILARESALC
ncbi:MAG: hypothetical protein ACLT98_05350 [Eggerthellaceae bacterium]